MRKLFLSLAASAAILGGLSSCAERTAEASADCPPSALDVIFARTSVRTYADRPVEQEKVDVMLRAAMAAPTGMDRRPWEFVVVSERDVLDRLAEGGAKMLTEAPLAVIVCGNTERSGYWYIDCSAAAQNLLLAAQAEGLGAVWTGCYPYEERMAVVSNVLELPDNVLPLCVIPVGYPAGEHTAKDKYDTAKVHHNKW